MEILRPSGNSSVLTASDRSTVNKDLSGVGGFYSDMTSMT